MEYKLVKEKFLKLFDKYNNRRIENIDYILSYYLNKSIIEIKFYNFNKKEIQQLNKYIIKFLKTNMPVQKLFKKAFFFKREFFVNKNVLTPRFDSEVLIEEILQKKFTKVLDLCAGSGCLGITLKCEKPEINLTIADISKKALNICNKNCKKHNIKAKLIETDMFKKINGKFDLIICNPPYIETETVKNLGEDVKNFDPILALDGGQDGLKFYNIIFKEIDNYLTINGKCIIEIGFNQGYLEEKFKEKYKSVKLIKDYNNLDRAIYFEKE